MLFYIFSSPFTGNRFVCTHAGCAWRFAVNSSEAHPAASVRLPPLALLFHRELRKKWTGYVYVSTVLYIWLSMAVFFHLPILQYDVRVPVSLFMPLFLASALTLFIAEGMAKVLNRFMVYHVGFRQNSLEVMQNAFVVSLACCLVYSQCGSVSNEGLGEWSTLIANIRSTKDKDNLGARGIDQMCVLLFSGHVNTRYAQLPMVFVLWCTAVSALVVNFIVERISGFRGMFSDSAALALIGAHTDSTGVLSGHSSHSRRQSLQRIPAATKAGGADGAEAPDDKRARAKEKQHASSDKKGVMASGKGADKAMKRGQVNGAPTSPSDSAAQRHRHSYKAQLKKIRPLLFKDMMDPPMLEMVPWYALLTSFTGVDMLIHLKLFVGRFDMRTLQAVTPNSFHYTPPLYPGEPLRHGGFTSSSSLNGLQGNLPLGSFANGLSNPASENVSPASSPHGGSKLHSSLPTPFQQSHHVHQHHLDAPLVYDHTAEEEELWFDWMSDCGDGWNSSYQVARVLAKPTLNVSVRRKGGRKPGALRLPRGKILVIGGDLAYPSPNEENYETRFFRPFQAALPPPLNYDPAALSMHKPPIPGGVAGLKTYTGPTCFAMPGNHDWFDGLQTYMRFVCCRDWLGGWLMPQERGFFALQFPKGWWFFALDNALSDDIDSMQFKYFASIIERMGEDDRVIIATHEPGWVIDTHDQRTSEENTNYLIKILKGKVALRIAGDIHNYTVRTREDAWRVVLLLLTHRADLSFHSCFSSVTCRPLSLLVCAPPSRRV